MVAVVGPGAEIVPIFHSLNFSFICLASFDLVSRLIWHTFSFLMNWQTFVLFLLCSIILDYLRWAILGWSNSERKGPTQIFLFGYIWILLLFRLQPLNQICQIFMRLFYLISKISFGHFSPHISPFTSLVITVCHCCQGPKYAHHTDTPTQLDHSDRLH